MFWHRENKTPLPLCAADLELSIINSNSCFGKNNPYLWILIRMLHLTLLFYSTAWDIPCPFLAHSRHCTDEFQPHGTVGTDGRRWPLLPCRKGEDRGAGSCCLCSWSFSYPPSPATCPSALPPCSPAAGLYPGVFCAWWGSSPRKLTKVMPSRDPHTPLVPMLLQSWMLSSLLGTGIYS